MQYPAQRLSAPPTPDASSRVAPATTEPSPTAIVAELSVDDRDRVRAAIVHDLTETERLLLLLWYAEGMNLEEIGMTIGLTVPQVAALHARVVARLRRCSHFVRDGSPEARQ